MKKDNRGFTLVELIVAIAIFVIVGAAAFGLMITSSRSYANVQTRIDLQLRSQQAMNQLSNYLIDANVGAAWDSASNSLYIIDTADSNALENQSAAVHVFALDSSGNLNYGSSSAAPTVTTASGKTTYAFSSPTASDLVVSGVQNLAISLTPVDAAADPKLVNTAEIKLTIKKGTQTYSAIKTVTLRNRPQLAVISAGVPTTQK